MLCYSVFTGSNIEIKLLKKKQSDPHILSQILILLKKEKVQENSLNFILGERSL